MLTGVSADEADALMASGLGQELDMTDETNARTSTTVYPDEKHAEAEPQEEAGVRHAVMDTEENVRAWTESQDFIDFCNAVFDDVWLPARPRLLNP